MPPVGDFEALKLVAKNIVLQAVGFTVAAADMVFNQQLSFFFTSLLVCPGACPPIPAVDNCP